MWRHAPSATFPKPCHLAQQSAGINSAHPVSVGVGEGQTSSTDMLTALKRKRAYQTLKHWRYLLQDPEYRRRDRTARMDFERFCHKRGGWGLRHNLRSPGPTRKTALIVSQYYLPLAKVEALIMKAMHMAGFETVVVGNRRYDFLRYGWLAGNKTVYEFSEFARESDLEWIEEQFGRLATLQDWLALEYEGAHVGRFTIASTLRRLRVGQLDYQDPSTRDTLRRILESSVHSARAGIRLLEEIKPDCVLVLDRGYSGYGEVFDLALNRGIDAIVWNVGYKSNRLILKRYSLANERAHTYEPSLESWRRMSAIPWKPEYGESVRDEIARCYQTQDWFSFIGSQFNKPILSPCMTRQKLDLTDDKKVAVIFPHILWDGSFFYGKDLFNDYTHWFVETLRAAAANPRLQWVVKLHPAHLVKAKQLNDTRRPSELDVLERAIGALPPHVKLVHPDTDLNTYSLFQIADYVVTVRGTVGMEAPVFGIPVVTAGTGRYDRRGFTLDSSTREEYLQRLATLESYPRLSADQVEIAERLAYEVLCCRPLRLSSVSLEYERDEIATPRVTVNCQTREQWLVSPDMQQLAAWLADGKTEDMLVFPAELAEPGPPRE